jgi:hypothetical protein
MLETDPLLLTPAGCLLETPYHLLEGPYLASSEGQTLTSLVGSSQQPIYLITINLEKFSWPANFPSRTLLLSTPSLQAAVEFWLWLDTPLHRVSS